MCPRGADSSGSASGETLSPSHLSELIGAIYDCALDPDLWESTLIAIAAALRCKTASLHLSDLSRNRLLVNRMVGVEPHLQELFRTEYLPEANAVLGQALRAAHSLDEPFVLSRDLTQAYQQSSPYIQVGLKLTGISDILQFFLMYTPTRFAGFAFGRDGIFPQREIDIGKLLLPHVRRSVTISNVLDAHTVERARVEEALNALRCGVVLTDEEGVILHANRSAERMLFDGSPIQSSHGVLGAKTRSAAKELHDAIKLAATNEAGIGKAGLAIHLSADGAQQRFAHVLPMNGGDLRPRLRPDAGAAVFIGAAPDQAEDADAVAAAYGLTPAETRLLTSLLTGRTLTETANERGIAVTTAKSHLESIFLKTGVSRQAELMLLVSRTIPPAQRSKEH